MKSIRFAFALVVSLFAASISSTVKAQAAYNSFVGDTCTVVTYNTRTAHGQGGWTIGNGTSGGTVNAYVIGGSGDATVDVTFGINIVGQGNPPPFGGRTTAHVSLVPGLGGQVGSTTTGAANGFVDSDDVGVHVGRNTSFSNPYAWMPVTPQREIAPRQITFTAHGDTQDTDVNTVNDNARSSGTFNIS